LGIETYDQQQKSSPKSQLQIRSNIGQRKYEDQEREGKSGIWEYGDVKQPCLSVIEIY
jgi:hypothetical protein